MDPEVDVYIQRRPQASPCGRYKPARRGPAPVLRDELMVIERRRIQFMVICDLYEKMKAAPVVMTRGRRRSRNGRFR
jgi:hypothetical protein